jgi:hypothetical protein
MGKPEPDRERIKQLTAEVRQLKAGEAKENPVKVEEKNQPLPSVKKKSESPSGSPPHEQKGIFSKLFTDLAPVSIGLAGTAKTDGQNARTTPREAKEMDSLKLSPISDSPAPTSAFMAFHNDQWEGPYTLLQLRSMGFLEPTTWVCRAGSEQVLQAYEMPDLQYFFHK